MRTMHDLSDEEKKNLFRDVVSFYGNGKTPEEIGQKYDLNKSRAVSVAAYLRKKGIEIPKGSSGVLSDRVFLQELQDLFRRRQQ